MENNLIILPEKFGIEEKKANELYGNLPQIKAERSILEQQYNEVITLDIEHPTTGQLASELRKKIKDNRTKGIEPWHKNTKEFFLKGGQFVDAIRRMEVEINERMEKNLEKIEKHLEIKEAQRIDKLKFERLEILSPYSEFVPFGLDYGKISDEEFNKVLNGAKLQLEAKIEQERKVEEERQFAIKKQKLAAQRGGETLLLIQFIKDYHSIDFAEISELAYSEIVENAKKSKSEHEAAQELIRRENERLRIEAAERQREHDKKMREIEAEREAERKAAEKKLQDEAAERKRLDDEIKAKAKAEEEKYKAELAAKRKAANAPDKIKLNELSKQLENMELPNLKSPDGAAILENVKILVEKIVNYINEKAETL